jgi:uncharacterized protein
MVNVNWLPAALVEGAERIIEALKLPGFGQGSHAWLAVTGLTRSGKTVFITSLIHNLLSALHNPNRMPLLRVVGDGRLIAAKLEKPNGHGLPRFPYRENVEAMAGSVPDWPRRTEDIGEIGIDVHFAPATALGKVIGQIGGSQAKLSIRVVDYPGEWLLDLPLLSQSYADWSRAALRLYGRGLRAQVAAPFLAFLRDHSYDEPSSDETARKAHELYCGFLREARDRWGLSFLQPGRFLCPGSLGEVPFLWFAPLDCPDSVDMPAPNTLAGLMAERFEVYKREAVGRFYDDHFRRYSRQIVLVDVLHALLAGREAFEDSRLAIEAILQSFRYGSGGMLAKLLRGAHIDKVLFAATKADHVPDVQRDHLAELLRNMAAFPTIDVKSSNAQFDVTALASVMSTAQDVQQIDGQTVPVVVGRPVGANKQARFFVGTVPIRPPRPDAWAAPFLNVPMFEPPPIDPAPVDGIPHINLDLALEFLIGDLLQ